MEPRDDDISVMVTLVKAGSQAPHDVRIIALADGDFGTVTMERTGSGPG